MRPTKRPEKDVLAEGVLFILLVCFLMILLQAVASASTVLPGLRAPLLDTPATPSTFRSGITSTYSGGLSVSDAEIQELARGLKYDPGLMYKFVHDHIRFTPMWGEVKGPYMTWMDRSGNSFDQAGLMLGFVERGGRSWHTVHDHQPDVHRG